MTDTRSPDDGETDGFESSNKGYVSFLLINPGNTAANQVAVDVAKQRYGVRWTTVVSLNSNQMVLAAVVIGTSADIATLITDIHSHSLSAYQIEELKVVNGEYYKLNAGVVATRPHNGWP